MASIAHLAERTAVSVTIDQALKYIEKHPEDRGEQIVKLLDMAKTFMGEKYKDESFGAVREIFADQDSKWNRYVNKMAEQLHPHVLKMHLLNLGFEVFFNGTKTIRENREKYGCNIPWLILMDPTSACNLHCTGCWAAEYGHKLNLSYEKLDDIIRQGKELGTYFYLLTGGEPLVRKKDVIRLAREHNDCAFHIFTNATLIDEEFCKEMQEVGNISLGISLEGFEEVNDGRRGNGVFDKVMAAMDLLKQYGILFGTSICYTKPNIETITSDAFLDMIEEKGCLYSWFFHYMPVGNDADPDLLPTMEQRKYMYSKVREIRRDRMLFTMDFQNDGEFVGGCIAGGRNYIHINSNGDVEPCVFIHFSGANINEVSLLESLQQPLFTEYREHQPFNRNLLQPCPMLENPEILQEMVRRSGAHSTDLQSPESAGHLCAKCVHYAREWEPYAEELWNKKVHPEHKYENYMNWQPKDDPEKYYSNAASLPEEHRLEEMILREKLFKEDEALARRHA